MHPAETLDEHFSRLMARAQQGDNDAYVTLLRAVAPRIRQIVRRKRGFLSEADVKDVVQDVLLSLHTVRATFNPARPFLPWLTAIVRYRLADAGRRHLRQASREVTVDDLDVTFPTVTANTEMDSLGDGDALAQARPCRPVNGRRWSC